MILKTMTVAEYLLKLWCMFIRIFKERRYILFEVYALYSFVPSCCLDVLLNHAIKSTSIVIILFVRSFFKIYTSFMQTNH